MTRIKIDQFSISVNGHSSAPRVNDCDLVCCAVSTLVCTLSFAVEEWYNKGKLNERPKIVTNSGEAFIGFNPKSEYINELETAFNAFVVGFMALSNQYGEYIKIE